MRTKLLLTIVACFLSIVTQSQIVHLVNNDNKNKSLTLTDKKEEKSVVQWVEGGNIDYVSSGIIQTNARIFKINIGEPKGFYVPFYITAGADKVTSSGADEDPNKSTNINLLSANGGYLNFGLHGNSFITDFKKSTKKGKESTSNTRLSFSYLLGAKNITGVNAVNNEKVNMLSFMTNFGLMFQTNAWVPDDESKKGLAWIQAVFSNTFNNEDKLKQIYGSDVEKNFYGYNIEAGIQIEDYINLRLGYYRYLNNRDINEDFNDGIFKLSVDFGILN